MIIAAPKRANDQRHLHERSPIKAKLPDRRPHEAADKDHLAATFLVGYPTNPSELAKPNPMMRIGLDGRRIGPSAERKQHHGPSSSRHRIGDRKRNCPGAANNPERCVGRRIDWRIGALISHGREVKVRRCSGLLPSPLWGGVGGGGRAELALLCSKARAPTPFLPHRGGGSPPGSAA